MKLYPVENTTVISNLKPRPRSSVFIQMGVQLVREAAKTALTWPVPVFLFSLKAAVT